MRGIEGELLKIANWQNRKSYHAYYDSIFFVSAQQKIQNIFTKFMIESRLVWLAAAFVKNTLAEGMNISTYSVAS